MTDAIIKMEIMEKRYSLAKEKMEKAEAALAVAQGRLAGLKKEVRDMQAYAEILKAELREKIQLLDEINDKLAGR